LLPAEEFIRVTKGADFGWPYCYYDQLQGKKVLAPEYGGDGNVVGRCADFELPLLGFPGHWAPNDLLFYTGDQFPERYKKGAFIAFHGSTNRAPYPQSGYFVCFVPFEDGKPTGTWEVFADGFANVDPIVNVSDALYRPMGLAQGPDGSLFVAETEKGKVWRIMYRGEKSSFGSGQLKSMDERKLLSHIRNPDIVDDNLDKDEGIVGAKVFTVYCATCHQQDGKGASGRFPPLAATDWVTGDKSRLIDLVLNGLQGSITVNGETYVNAMPQHSFLSDEEVANVLTYIRQSFGNNAGPVTLDEVAAIRKKTNTAP
jgi:mono/diheme cytochrome c family protein